MSCEWFLFHERCCKILWCTLWKFITIHEVALKLLFKFKNISSTITIVDIFECWWSFSIFCYSFNWAFNWSLIESFLHTEQQWRICNFSAFLLVSCLTKIKRFWFIIMIYGTSMKLYNELWWTFKVQYPDRVHYACVITVTFPPSVITANKLFHFFPAFLLCENIFPNGRCQG